ncbi:MAG: antitoxin MazE family protein [Cytophagales bacterium]|nr:antitoxin MazE family protein [Cytophagales bacterium]
MAETAVRVREHRQRLRMAGLRPVQIWVPDTRRPDFAEECRRQSQIVEMGDKADTQDTQLDALMDQALSSIEGWT